MSADLDDSAARTVPVASQRLAIVVENVAIARDTYRLRLEDPVLARSILPGQFVMIRPAADGADDHLLGRPFALYDVVTDTGGTPIAIDIVYLVVGRGTTALARRRPGDELSVWGPLGNGFGPAPGGSVLFVAGGIGQTPFLALGRWWMGKMSYGTAARDLAPPCSFSFSGSTSTAECHRCSSATLLYGVRTAELLAGLKDFRQMGIDVEIATDDGSAGHHGYVTDLLARRLQRGERAARVVGCGPFPMLAALARLVEPYEIPCDVSLENHMACGFGVCFSCVTSIRQPDGTTDLRRVCMEGPVFAASRVAWSG